jgi:hypothetical protein
MATKELSCRNKVVSWQGTYNNEYDSEKRHNTKSKNRLKGDAYVHQFFSVNAMAWPHLADLSTELLTLLGISPVLLMMTRASKHGRENWQIASVHPIDSAGAVQGSCILLMGCSSSTGGELLRDIAISTGDTTRGIPGRFYIFGSASSM